MARNVRDVIMFSGFDPALSELSAAGTFRLLARAADGVPMVSVNGGAYAPLAGVPFSNDFVLAPNTVNALLVHDGVADYLAIDTVVGAPAMRFGEAGVIGPAFSFNMRDAFASAFVMSAGGNDYQTASTVVGAEGMTWGESNAFAMTFDFHIKDNHAAPFEVIGAAGVTRYYQIVTLNGGEHHLWNGDGPGARYSFELRANHAAAFVLSEAGGGTFLLCGTAAGSEVFGVGNGTAAGVLTQFLVPSAAGAFNVLDFDSGMSWIRGDGALGSEELTFNEGTLNAAIIFGGTQPMVMGARALAVQEIGADPGAAGNSIMLYSKDVAGVSRLFAQLSDGTVVSLTP